MGIYDVGSDESIASSPLEQAAGAQCIVRITAITPINIQISLRDSGTPASFTFSRTWHVPCLVLQLSERQRAFLNVTFCVADDETTGEDLLVGLLVLCHLGIDSRTLLEQKWSSLDGTDCSNVANYRYDGRTGRIGRLFLARLQVDTPTVPQGETFELDPDRPRSYYFGMKQVLDPFPDPFLLKPDDEKADAEAARL